jgi:glycerol-3-phosphate dehydrogenase (NAD(P)+)
VPVLSLTKGLEQGSHLRMTQVVNEVLPGHPAAVLTGPNLAREILEGNAAAAVVATPDPVVADYLQQIFHMNLFRVYTNPDVCRMRGRRRAQERDRHRRGHGRRPGDRATTPRRW